MTELAMRRYEDLASWAHSAREVHTIVQFIAGTEFVPRAMRDRPEACMAAVLIGSEIGLMPMVSLAVIDIIDGKPSLNALVMRALVQGHGHELQTVEKSDTRVIIRGRRKDSSHWETSEWTLDRAKKANLLHKQNWQRTPQAMLVARATSEVCRLIAADALVGLAYSQEELADGIDTVAEEPAPTSKDKEPAPKVRMMKRQPLEPPHPALPAEPAETAEAWPEVTTSPPQVSAPEAAEVRVGGFSDPDAEKPATQEQRNILHHSLGQLGIINDKLKFVRETTGRHSIKNTSDLTREEAARCIETAGRMIAEQRRATETVES